MNASRRGRTAAPTLPDHSFASGFRAIASAFRAIASAFLAIASIFMAGCDLDQSAGREENYVTVRLNDSLSLYDSVEILILADGDTSEVIGKVWDGRLAAPQEVPPYRLDDAETRTLSVRVKGYDRSGRLTLDMRISKRNGAQVVTNVALPKPSPALAALAVGPGELSPDFDPTVKEYAVALAHNQTWLQVTMTPAYAQAIMSAGPTRAYAGKAAEPIDMRVGVNRVVLNVAAADTSTQYVIDATRAPAPADTVAVPPDTSQANPFSAWKHMALIALDFKQVGMGGLTGVVDVPILVRLAPSDFNLAEAGENGKDLRFATRDHRMLPHEIASWDAQAGSARIWIKPDTLRDDTANGSIRMYWGNPSAASTSDAAKVFAADAGWSGVWHLEEEGKGASGEYKDATGRFHAASSGKDPPSRTEGAIGLAQDFKSAGAQGAISIPAAFDPGPDAWTMTFWVKQENQGKGVIFAKGDGTAPDKERFQLIVQQDGRLGAQRFAGKAFTNVYFPANAWCHVGIVNEGNTAHFYVDGAKWETLSGGQGPDSLAKVFLGALNADGSDGYDGSLDEVWFSRTARSKDFMRLLFENQKPGSPVVTVRPQR